MKKKIQKDSFFDIKGIVSPNKIYKILNKRIDPILALLIVSALVLGDLYVIYLIFTGTFKTFSFLMFMLSICLWAIVGLFGIYCFIFGFPEILINVF